ncbi:hypothetical protein AGABI2DRAFT_191836, partial [Agaricus bisporus var. bisporus H97]|uniref:hypothetical protein n=1 Tax=Agaricus bisporus var. bisporus (strain H97 / ATCC MYA-4626 / FGSC 10389) TaxID=936046 RepID=UPI00029F658C
MFVRPVARIRLPRYQTHASRRSLFGLPDPSFMSPFITTSETQKYNERRVLPYSPRQLYDVVSNVSTYPQFVPFCTGSHILRPLIPEPGSERFSMEAELTVGFLSFKESYVSKVTCLPYESVEAVASSATSLFKTLTTTWRFQPVSSYPSARIDGEEYGRTLVILDLAYAFTNPLHASVSAAFFGQISKLMIQAFENRCQSIYGPGE